MPAVLDPSGFMMSVVVIGGDGTRYPLWTKGASTEEDRSFFRNEEAQFQDLPIVQSVSVELNRGLNGSASVEFVAPFELGIELINSDLFVIGNGLEVRIGYPRLGRFLPWFRTMSVKPDLTIDGSEGMSATLNGQGGRLLHSGRKPLGPSQVRITMRFKKSLAYTTGFSVLLQTMKMWILKMIRCIETGNSLLRGIDLIGYLSRCFRG